MPSIFGSQLILNKIQQIAFARKEKTNRRLFELDDKRKVKATFFSLSHMDVKTFQVEGIYHLLTEFEARTKL